MPTGETPASRSLASSAKRRGAPYAPSYSRGRHRQQAQRLPPNRPLPFESTALAQARARRDALPNGSARCNPTERPAYPALPLAWERRCGVSMETA